MASVHVAIGDSEGGIRLLQEARWPYDVMRKQPPADLDIQLAWSYLDADGREKELYALLTTINLRNDLTPSQRENVRNIWSTWSLRRSQQALDEGDEQRAIAILTAAAQALPMDNKIRAGLAGVFLRTGDPRRALLVYEKWGMVDAQVDDYLGAIGAAMSVQATQLAEHWTKVALQRWPKSAPLLEVAGKQAAAHGDYNKAEAYWKAALEAMPTDRAKDSLFGILGQGKEAPHQSQATQNLARLLMPDGELPRVNRNGLTRVYTPRAQDSTTPMPADDALPSVPEGNPAADEQPARRFARTQQDCPAGHAQKTAAEEQNQSSEAPAEDYPATRPISLHLGGSDYDAQDTPAQHNSDAPVTASPPREDLVPSKGTTAQQDTDQALGDLIERKSSRWGQRLHRSRQAAGRTAGDRERNQRRAVAQYPLLRRRNRCRQP